MIRCTFLAGAVTALLVATGLSIASSQHEPAEYLYHGRVPGHKPFQGIDSGLTMKKIETFTKGAISAVKLTTDDGSVGWGQISTYDVDISAIVLHRRVARHFLGKDPAGQVFERMGTRRPNRGKINCRKHKLYRSDRTLFS